MPNVPLRYGAVAEAAFRIRAYANPGCHLLRLPEREKRDGVSPDRGLETPNPRTRRPTEFEPTTFIYAYMAWNSLFNYDWAPVMPDTSMLMEAVVQDGGGVEAHLLAHVRYTLADEEERTAFHARVPRTPLKSGLLPSEELEGLYEFKRDSGLRQRAIAAAKKFEQRRVPAKAMDGAIDMFKAVHEVRCNLFHGAKDIGGLPEDDPQFTRIAIFRGYTTALLDTFFGKLRRLHPEWHYYFGGSMQDVVDHPVSTGAPRQRNDQPPWTPM